MARGAQTTVATVGGVVRNSMGALTPAERRVARVLLSAYPTAGLESMTALAARARVSGPTVLRFVNKLGFQGYPEFQRSLREEIQAQISSPLSLYGRRARPERGHPATDPLLRQFVKNLEATFASLPAAEFRAVVELLADPRRRILSTGGHFSQMAAFYLYAHLHYLRPKCRFIGAEPAPRDDELIDIGPRDVVNVFDYRRYQRDTIEFARGAAARGATVVLFTDPWLSPIAEVADHVLTAAVEAPSPFDSLVGAVAMIDALVAGVVERIGERGRRRIAQLEELRASLAWWHTPVGGSEGGRRT